MDYLSNGIKLYKIAKKIAKRIDFYIIPAGSGKSTLLNELNRNYRQLKTGKDKREYMIIDIDELYFRNGFDKMTNGDFDNIINKVKVFPLILDELIKIYNGFKHAHFIIFSKNRDLAKFLRVSIKRVFVPTLGLVNNIIGAIESQEQKEFIVKNREVCINGETSDNLQIFDKFDELLQFFITKYNFVRK